MGHVGGDPKGSAALAYVLLPDDLSGQMDEAIPVSVGKGLEDVLLQCQDKGLQGAQDGVAFFGQ